MKMKIKSCLKSDLEHSKSKRQYCHVGHIENTICIASEFVTIPFQHQMALLAHEVGHTFDKDRRKTEAGADNTVMKLFGVQIRYPTRTPWGNNLEYVLMDEAMVLYKYLTIFIDPSFLRSILPSQKRS